MKTEPESGLLQRIAEAIADSTPVEWQTGDDLHGMEEDSLRQLRILEKIAAVHRGGNGDSTPVAEDLQGVARESPPIDDDLSAQEPPARWGPLEIRERIGKGRFGKVYRAHDPSLGIDVALKLQCSERTPAESKVKLFLEEARRLAHVKHPNVLVVHGADRHEGRVGLWTELLEGKTLEDCLDQQGSFSAHEATLVGIELCRALSAVHGAGLIHGDVKTTNVMRQKGGKIILLDFSAARECHPLNGSDQDEPVVGTPRFMAPEILLGEGPCSPSTDIYSLGVLLYRLASGSFPVDADTFSTFAEKLRSGHSTPILDVRPDLPHAFVQVLERALARDPNERYASAGEMEQALAASLGVTPRRKEAPRWRWFLPVEIRLSVRLVAAVVVLLALVATFGPMTFNWLWPPPLSVEASLFRVNDGLEQRLQSGQRVYLGDLLSLELRGSSEMHVYVMNEPERGTGIVLFPVEGMDVQNPLPPNTLHRLPSSAGSALAWDIDSAGGRESIFVIASRDPLTDFERELGAVRTATLQEPERIAAQTPEERSRGMGISTEGGSSLESRGPISRYFEKVSQTATEDPDIWVWRIQLENPDY